MANSKQCMESPSNTSLVIRADASTEIGTGHLMRCLALAQAWKDAGGQVIFISACQNEGLLKRLREEKFDVHVLGHPYPDSSDWDYTKDILADHTNACVVLDGYHFDEVYQRQVKELGHRLIVIDDMAHLKHYYADIVLNQNLHAEQLQYPCEPYTRLLLGTRYVLLRREFLSWKDWKREIPEIARRVLVTLGGGDPENYTLKVIKALQKVDVPGLEITVVIGASNPHANVLEAAKGQSSIPIRLVHNTDNMPALMTWADVAVSAAGSTLWELMFMGVPALAVVVAPNQEANARALQEKQIALILNTECNHDSVNMNKLSKVLLVGRQARLAMSQLGKVTVDGFGASRITATIMAHSPVSHTSG